MRSEDRESAGLQEGPAHVPKMERHTLTTMIVTVSIIITPLSMKGHKWSLKFYLPRFVEVWIEPDSVVSSSE